MTNFRAVLIGDGGQAVNMPEMTFVQSGMIRYDTVSFLADAVFAAGRLCRTFKTTPAYKRFVERI